MLTPVAIRPWLRLMCAAVALGGMSDARAALYHGGEGDGFSAAGLSTRRLDGSPLASPAYTASLSGGDGYDFAGRINRTLDGSSLPAAVFTASITGGDGYDFAGRINRSLDGSSLPVVLYTTSLSGGDGYDTRGLITRPLDSAVEFTAAYSGGLPGGDGYDTFGLIETPLDAALAYYFIYSGGEGDGYDTRGLIHTPVDGSATALSPYVSSNTGADGYDVSGSTHTRLDGTLLPAEIFTASLTGGDGYDLAGATHQNLNGTSHFVLAYLGTTGDGYDTLGLRHSALDPATLLPATVFTGAAGDGYDIAIAPYIFYLGEGGAASAMTYSIWRYLKFSPEETAAGLAADTADADHDGLPNLLEYTIGSDPRLSDSAIYGPQYRLSNLTDFGRPALPDYHLTAVVHRNPRIFDATLSVEISDDLITLWGRDNLIEISSPPSLLIIRDALGIQEAPRRHMRLRATLNE